jgi:hypothetical protein
MQLKHIAIMLFVFASTRATGQTQTPIPELRESFRLSEFYRGVDFLSFTALVSFADSSNPASPVDQYILQHKYSNGRYRIEGDSAESVQGFRYAIIANKREQTLSVSKPERFMPLLQLHLADPDFRKANIDSSFVTPVNDSTRKIRINFKAESPYSAYEVTYHAKKLLISSIRYFLRNDYLGVNANGTAGTTVVNLQFSGFSFDPFNTGIFDEDRFVTRQNGAFVAQPSYSGYRLLSGYIGNVQ